MEECYVCGRVLEHAEIFPKDFPDKFKLCCFCHYYATDLIEDSLVLIIKDLPLDEFIKQQYKKINNLISLKNDYSL